MTNILMNIEEFVVNVGSGIGIILGIMMITVPVHTLIMWLFLRKKNK